MSDVIDDSARASARRSRFRSALDSVATLAIIIAAAVMVWSSIRPSASSPSQRPTVPIPTQPLSLDGAPVLGSPTAKVVIVEFSDFQCPYCQKFSRETLPALKTKYIDSGRVALAFRNLPLPIHARAERAAVSAECANQQGKFWAMHDQLFAGLGGLQEEDLLRYGHASHLDETAFRRCLDGNPPSQVTSDLGLAKALSVTGTPTFVIGTRLPGSKVKSAVVAAGAMPLADFGRSIERLLDE